MAASQAALEILYFRGLLREMGVDMSQPTVLYVDNQGAVELSKDLKSCQRSRHVERRYLKVRELVHSGDIVVRYRSTDLNHADLLTKPLDADNFKRHVDGLMNTVAPTNSTPATPTLRQRSAPLFECALRVWLGADAVCKVRLIGERARVW